MQSQKIERSIYEVRGQKVLLDSDLALLYGTETKRLKEAVKRNIHRFPSDFLFILTKKEVEILRTQFASSKSGGSRYLPFAFTEQGVAMLASVLHSAKAIQVNISIVRAFVLMRQYSLSHKDLTSKLKSLEKKYNKQFKDIYEAMSYLINKDKVEKKQKSRKRIGFRLTSERAKK